MARDVPFGSIRSRSTGKIDSPLILVLVCANPPPNTQAQDLVSWKLYVSDGSCAASGAPNLSWNTIQTFDPATGLLTGNPPNTVPTPGCSNPAGSNTVLAFITLSPTVRMGHVFLV